MKTKLISAGVLALLAGGFMVMSCASNEPTGTDDTKAVNADVREGGPAPALEATPRNREEAQAHANALLAEWKAKNPDRDWEAEVRAQHYLAPSYDNSALLAEGQGAGDPGRHFTERDLLIWKRETERLVAEGARIFHSGDELGSPISVSCDMCHPDAANTHPETYPKYQTQIGKAVLLRDMINWCLQHPLRAEPMAEDDPRLRALEAYIIAQRTGTPLAYGKH